MKRHLRLTLLATTMAGGAFAQINGWTTIILHGKVTMDDGSPPPKMVVLERFCSDQVAPDNVAYTDKNGLYIWKMEFDVNDERRCTLQAVLSPYKSNRYIIPDFNAFSDPNLPLLVLTVNGSNAANVFDETTTTNEIYGGAAGKVPSAVERDWTKAQDFVRKGRWADAERSLKLATMTVPKFARGWEGLAVVLERENKPAEAWKDYKLAIEADPKLLGSYLPLARLSVDVKDWETAEQVTAELIKRDTLKRYAEARLIHAMACYQKKDFDGAVASATEAIKMDPKSRLPSAEELLGLSLAAKGDYDNARQHLNRYLDLIPRPPNLEELKAYNANLGKTEATAPEVVLGMTEIPSSGVPGEAWVPGGRKALAQVAGLKDASSYEKFFADYCRALAREMTVGTSQGIPGYLDSVRAYMAAVTELLPQGQRNGDVTTITLSLATDSQRKTAANILPMLGWKLVPKDGAYSVEPGDQAADGLRQRIPRLFGIDEIAMQETLEAGKPFQFDIPTENARVVGGNDWSPLLKELPSVPGGIAAAFTQDVRVARTYAGLGAMSPEVASTVIRAVGVRNLVLRDSDVLARFGDAFEMSKDAVAVPGGPAAEPAWKKLVGANPSDPAAFFRAVLEKNEGRLAAFYFAVWSADKAHQAYITKTEARADRFYAWYRDSEEFKFGLTRYVPGWRTDLLEKLPLDAAGNIAFPGGKRAWTNSTAPEDEGILGMKTLEALVPVAQVEQRRGSPLDEASVTLLAQHYSEWHSLFPYFEKLPSLGREEFASLQAFAAAVSKQPPLSQNVVLGEWYSLVELIARGYKAGSLDAAATARAFRGTCEGLSREDHSAKALATLREIAGGSNLNEAVPANLLRLSPERRSAFERVLELQSVPLFDPKTMLSFASASSASYNVTLAADAVAGDTQLSAGTYKVTVEDGRAVFTTGKQTIEVVAGMERTALKFPATMVEISGNKIQAIDLAGTDTKIVFTPATSSAVQSQPQTVALLSGFVYAAAVNPDGLLVSEDRQLLSRHQFAVPAADDKRPFEFAPTALVGSNTAPGSYLTGSFVNFQEVAHDLAFGGRSAPPITLKSLTAQSQSTSVRSGVLLASAETGPSAGDGPATDLVFRASGRLVEVPATVTDARGRYIDDLTAGQFTLLDGQQPQTLVAFESHSNPVSVALLLDTTGSMNGTLPAVKNAALKLIGDLRPIDSVAVYSFNRTVTELQPFTSDLDAAKRAVLSTQAAGETALYDALARVSRDLSGRTGKKVIVLFTDGDDNSSTLTMDNAILRVKAAGIPVYTIAQGDAAEAKCVLSREGKCVSAAPPPYVKQLADLAKVTGGESFAVKGTSEIGGVFAKVSEDLAHGYLLVFQPPASEDHTLHPITIQIRGVRGDKIRARESYSPE